MYHDGGANDVLYDYGIHKSGKLINPAGHWINDGFNEARQLPEDVSREQVGIEKIGNAEVLGGKNKCKDIRNKKAAWRWKKEKS